MNKCEILKELDNIIIAKENDIKYANKFDKTEDKVKYLRIIKGYKQSEVAEMIGRSTRQIQRIERKLKGKLLFS